MPNFKLISIEGNIGSGKSTLLENLRERFGNHSNVIFLREPVDDWDAVRDENGVTMLQKFYDDKMKYSFPFQMMAYISRLANIKNVIRNHENVVIISERSLNTDKEVFAKMLFDNGFIELVNYKIYLNWFNAFVEDCPVTKIIYVKADPSICEQRIKKRSRVGENNISIEYLQTCHDYHEKMLALETICRDQLILDGNNNILEDKELLAKWLDDIEDFVFVR